MRKHVIVPFRRRVTVPRRRSGWGQRPGAASEVVARSGRSTAGQHAAVPDRHGSLRPRFPVALRCRPPDYRPSISGCRCAILFRRSIKPLNAILGNMKVEEIAEAVAKLPPDQLARFRRWFTAFEAGRTDHAKELDSAATKLGRFAGRAFADLKRRAKEP
jgi:hypothetical protein